MEIVRVRGGGVGATAPKSCGTKKSIKTHLGSPGEFRSSSKSGVLTLPAKPRSTLLLRLSGYAMRAYFHLSAPSVAPIFFNGCRNKLFSRAAILRLQQLLRSQHKKQ